MLDWILDNKEWLFSGIGITILTVIIVPFLTTDNKTSIKLFFSAVPTPVYVITLILLVSFTVGLYNGYRTRLYSNDEFLDRYIFSHIVFRDDNSTKYFMEYNCGTEPVFRYDIDKNKILRISHYPNASNNLRVEDTSEIIRDVIPPLALASLSIVSYNFFDYFKNAIKTIRINNKGWQAVLFVVGTFTTYQVGKWAGKRKEPKCQANKIMTKLAEEETWKKYEKYMYFELKSKYMLGVVVQRKFTSLLGRKSTE